MRPTLLAAFSLGLSSVAACSGDDGGAVEVNCDLETRDDDFLIGLTKPGTKGLLDFALMDATPAPPVRGDNTWVVQVNQKTSAAPVMGASLYVTPYMPDHGHVSPIEVEVTTMPTAGQYELTPVNLWMPGLWETTIEAESASGNDTVVFKFCVPS